MRVFTAKTDGANRLGMRELLQRYANEQWVAAHATPAQAAESVLDCFKRAIRQELELLDLDCCLNVAAPDVKDPATRLAIFESQSVPGSDLKFREDWDQIASLNAEQVLHIYRRCHTDAGLRAEYRDGKLLLSCAECWQPLAFVAVASRESCGPTKPQPQ
jgi:hypothetical protein